MHSARRKLYPNVEKSLQVAYSNVEPINETNRFNETTGYLKSSHYYNGMKHEKHVGEVKKLHRDFKSLEEMDHQTIQSCTVK